MKVFLDPSLPAVSLNEFPKPAKPEPVMLVIDYKVNDVGDPKAVRRTRPGLESSINRSGFFVVKDKAPNVLRVSIAEKFNESDVVQRSRMVGESFGAYGTVVTSDFSVSAQLERPNRLPFGRSYQTKFNVVVGNREVPADLHPMPAEQGTQEFCDRLTFGFIRDLIKAGDQ